MAAAMCLCSGMTAYAAPETMPDGTVFDAEYYAQTYPDVAASLGTDRDILYNHYAAFGKSEGRLPYSPDSVQTAEHLTSGIKKVSCKTLEEVLVFSDQFCRYPEFMLTESRPIKEQYWSISKEDSSKIWKGGAYAYFYDQNGNLISREDSYPRSYAYDSQGRPIYYGYDDGLSHCDLKYDEQGRMISKIELHSETDLYKKIDYVYE